jgi:FkbM family methyltransferase
MAKFFKKLLKIYLGIIDKKINKLFINSIKQLPELTSLTLIDIGAAGDIEPRWKKVQPILDYIGFEPDQRSRAILQEKNNNCLNYQILPYAIWDSENSIQINLCSKPQVSSSFMPNRNFVDLFPDSKRFDIESKVTLPTERLDNLSISSVDFMKIDIQGGELKALSGGVGLLEKTLGLEIEVEFLPMYSNQPLFGEISEFVTAHGFQFIDFVSLMRWQRNEYNGFGQCVFADALFLKTPEKLLEIQDLNNVILSKYLSICLLYNRYDLIERIIELIGYERSNSFQNFLSAIQPIKSRQNKIIKMTTFASNLIRFFGNEYKVHITY